VLGLNPFASFRPASLGRFEFEVAAAAGCGKAIYVFRRVCPETDYASLMGGKRFEEHSAVRMRSISELCETLMLDKSTKEQPSHLIKDVILCGKCGILVIILVMLWSIIDLVSRRLQYSEHMRIRALC
jgi:hypothetical protein